MVLKRTINEMSFIWPYEINITNSLSFCVFFVRIHMQSFFSVFILIQLTSYRGTHLTRLGKLTIWHTFIMSNLNYGSLLAFLWWKRNERNWKITKKGRLLDFIQFYMLKSVISDISYKCMNHVFFYIFAMALTHYKYFYVLLALLCLLIENWPYWLIVTYYHFVWLVMRRPLVTTSKCGPWGQPV